MLAIYIIVPILLAYLLLRISVVLWLLHRYSKAIRELPFDRHMAKLYLSKRGLNGGLCEACNYIWGSEWIDRYNPKTYDYAYWYKIPVFCDTFDEMKDTLVLRRDRLKYVLKRLTIFN